MRRLASGSPASAAAVLLGPLSLGAVPMAVPAVASSAVVALLRAAMSMTRMSAA